MFHDADRVAFTITDCAYRQRCVAKNFSYHYFSFSAAMDIFWTRFSNFAVRVLRHACKLKMTRLRSRHFVIYHIKTKQTYKKKAAVPFKVFFFFSIKRFTETKCCMIQVRCFILIINIILVS